VFRIVQEALTNVHCHTGSSVANISVTRHEAQIILEVADQGRGLCPAIPFVECWAHDPAVWCKEDAGIDGDTQQKFFGSQTSENALSVAFQRKNHTPSHNECASLQASLPAELADRNDIPAAVVQNSPPM
jgi:hypothetical protein